MAAGGERRRTVKDSDVIEPEKSALKNVRAVGIFAVHPPGEIQQQLVKHFFQKPAIRYAAKAPFYFVNTPRGPGMHRRIYITKRPFIGGELAIWMQVPFAKQQDELFLGEIRIHQ